VHRLRQRIKHPEFKDRTIWDVFQDERASLMELRGPFDGFVEKAVARHDHLPDRPIIIATASTHAPPAGWSWLRSHTERIVVLFNDEIVADHPRQFPARPDHLRSLALSAGSGEEARRIAQRRPIQGLGPAGRPDPGPRRS